MSLDPRTLVKQSMRRRLHRRRRTATRHSGRQRCFTFEQLEPLTLLANGTATVEFTSVPSEVEPNELVDVSVRYRLTNNTRSGPWDVELGLYDEDAVLDDRIRSISTQINRQNVWYDYTFRNVDLSDYDDAGDGIELYAKVVIDDNDFFNPGNPDDTTPVRKVTVGTPDLVASGISLSQSTACPGERIKVEFTVRNQGDKSTISFSQPTGSSNTAIMLSANSSISSTDTELAKEFLGPLLAGTSSVESRSFDLPSSVAPGAYYIGTIVDIDNVIKEGTTGETNNSSAAPRSITILDCRPDLRVSSLTVSDTTVAVGDEVEITAEVVNDGLSNASISTVRYYFGSNRGGRDTYIGQGIVPNIGVLSPGETSTDSPTGFPQPDFSIPNVSAGTYYISAFADDLNDVDESDEGNNLRSVEITVGTVLTQSISPVFCGTTTGPGVTIITAGFQGGGGPGSTPPDWTLEMAEAILERSESPGSIFVHNPTTNTWVTPTTRGVPSENWEGRTPWVNSNDLADEIVLVFDWTWESNDLQEGWVEAAADSLFTTLVTPFSWPGNATINLLTRPLHFIGHSRGTVLNSLAASRLAYHFPTVAISQFTTLDPHPSTVHNDPGSASQLLNIPDNISWADNYYREDGLYELDGDFDGVPVPAAWNLQLIESQLQGAGYAQEHSDVHLWYLATIKESAAAVEDKKLDEDFTDWWTSGQAYDAQVEPNSGRDRVGFARSRIGGLPQLYSQMDRSQMQRPQAPASVFNGDFEFGDVLLNEIPGWERHGGGGSGNLDTSGGNGYLQLNRNDDQRKHNALYVPSTVTGIRFDYWIHDNDEFNSNDVLEVLFGSEVLETISLAEETNGYVRNHLIPLTSTQVGSVSELEFRLGGPGAIDSGVRIDNVHLDGIVPGQMIAIQTVHPTILSGRNDPSFDFDQNGTVDSADGIHFINSCLDSYLGDADLDRDFDTADLVAVLQSGRYEQKIAATWTQGDWNFDGFFDTADFVAALQQGAYETGPRPRVPEAAALAARIADSTAHTPAHQAPAKNRSFLTDAAFAVATAQSADGDHVWHPRRAFVA